jgi:hypothetical protein
MFNHPRQICIDCAAFNDVAIHGRSRPRSADELRAGFIDEQDWAASASWPDLHHEYVNLFAHYLGDKDTLAWRDERKRRLSRGRR